MARMVHVARLKASDFYDEMAIGATEAAALRGLADICRAEADETEAAKAEGMGDKLGPLPEDDTAAVEEYAERRSEEAKAFGAVFEFTVGEEPVHE